MGWDVERLQGWRLPKNPLPDPVVYVESLFAPTIAEQLGISLLEPPEWWLDALPEQYSKRCVEICTAGQARLLLGKCESNYFIKPPNDKSFPAKHYAELPEYVPDSTTVLMQDVVEWEKEFRCFCLNDKVRTLSVYCRHGMVQKHEDWYATPSELYDAGKFAEEVLANIPAPRAIVMDVGVIKDRGWAVVELNAAWGSGIYGCDPKQVLEVVKACCEDGQKRI